MITAAIIINGQPIMARSATNQNETNRRGESRYLVDDGKTVWHDPEDGAVPLAIKLLETIEEQVEPNKHSDPNESNLDRCKRLAAEIPKDKLIRGLLEYIHANRKRNDKDPLWSKVGEATAHGSGVSSAIVAMYWPELKE